MSELEVKDDNRARIARLSSESMILPRIFSIESDKLSEETKGLFFLATLVQSLLTTHWKEKDKL